MAKHTILLALLAALVLLVAHTSATRDQKHDQERRCREQIENLNLKHCEKHIMKKVQSQEDEDEDEDVLMMRGINYIRNKEDREDEEKSPRQRCCSQLSQVNMMDCRCEAMKQVMDSLNDKLEKREMKEAEKEMWKLPMRCGMAPPFGCDLMRRDEN